MNPSFNQHENIKNTNLAQPRNKKAIPISLITGTDSIFIKGKINNVATSYFESSQKIQNLYKEKNSYIKKDTLKKNSKPKINHFKYSTSSYNNTFNVSVGNTIHDNKKNIIKISSINDNGDKINSFNLIPSNNLNSTRLNRNKNNTIIKEEIDSYKHIKSNTNNNLSKEYNNIKKSSNKSLRQIRQNVKKTISMIVHGNSISKIKDKNNKKNIKKNITYYNNYLNNQIYKKEFDISKDRSLEKKNNIIKNQNIEKPKKTLKQFIIKKKLDVKSKINEIKETDIIKPNTTMNKSNISITYKINLNPKNSNNKSTAITTSRTETSCEKKFEEKKDVIKKKLPLNNKNINLNLLSLIQENNKKFNNNSKEKNRINDSLDKKENSFENIQNILSNNIDLLNDKKFIEFDNFDDLNSIVKKLPFDKIEKDLISIFSVKNNLKYEIYIKNFKKVSEYRNSKKNN